jgi:pyruvate/2-oxoglutarate dehydrogenase complex dihydrolipoamide acyltransferase (E2) component
MLLEIKVPSVGESVTEATLGQADGVLKITVQEGETVAIGTVVGTIDTEAAPEAAEEPAPAEAEEEVAAVEVEKPPPAAPAPPTEAPPAEPAAETP